MTRNHDHFSDAKKVQTRIVIVISTMGPGGAERVVSYMSGFWADAGKQVILITLSRETPFYTLSESVEVVGLGVMAESKTVFHGVRRNIGRVKELKAELKKTAPDVVISFMDKTNVLVLLAARGLGVPVIVSERTFPGSYKIGAAWNLLRKYVYPLAFKVVAVTEEMKRALTQKGIANVTVIPNPVLPPRGGSVARLEPRKERILLAAGRLEYLKGFDLLIEAFSKVHESHPEWVVVITGSGELATELCELAGRLGIGDKVELTGTVQNMPAYLQQADVFVLSSRFEGFPNVLVEAMAAGKPVVAADCSSGPAEIIRHNENGLLVGRDDVEELAQQLDLIMGNSALRCRLGANARKITDAYSLRKVMHQWDALVDGAIAG